ncbi:hypothetical protein ACH36K_10545 [Clostridium sp. MB05]|jgi:prefoldin subunit 5
MSNDEIYEKIHYLNRRIQECEDSIYYLKKANNKCNSISNGIRQLETSQYEKVCGNCEDGIGREEVLLEKLKLSHSNISSINDNISNEISNAINAVNNEINNLHDRISSLYNQLEY